MKFLFLILISAVFTVAVSGCGYNSFFASENYGKPLTNSQIGKLNEIMFAYLDIPSAKFSLISPSETHRKADADYYRPSDVIQIAKASNQPQLVKNNRAENLSEYKAVIKRNKLFLKIFTRQTIRINKTLGIGKVDITVKDIRYDKGYEVVSLLVKNLGGRKIVKENFKYSNGGRTFGMKKYEILQNLTVADKYKKGMILCVKILNF
ncbi:MAG: hypothetical protein M0016_02475 [Deltaproteobacteria bacterium]|jgi:hypothetical protein|nr:hypothetical protein [Deltaproteobacteria bacterium]MDA8304013.1 hypothetical protein [Deltaproteobacteria bacterium]